MKVLEARFHDERLTVGSLAHEIATSDRQLQRVFAEVGRTTFRGELQRMRMESATRLLSDASLSVTEVASAVGYRETDQFSKVFRQRVGITPSRYRFAQPGSA